MTPREAPAAGVAAEAPAVAVAGVTQRFPARQGARVGEVLALDDVTLTVARGALTGVLGPNGAGKTTLLRLICALLRPTAGSVRVMGFDPRRDAGALRARVGAVLGGERSVYWRLTGRENLLYAAALHDMSAQVARLRADELLRWVGLSERADDLVERYSTGMRLRLAMARALMHDPPLLVLDEPTAGLDPHAAEAMRSLLRHLQRDPTRTILIATHNMAEAERLCTMVAILDRGRLVAHDAPGALTAPRAREGRPATLEAIFFELTAGAGSAGSTNVEGRR
jgi:ABC-2 type transport system ATP-binding protein